MRHRAWSRSAVAAAGALVAAMGAEAGVVFHEEAAPRGLLAGPVSNGMSTGLIAADYDDDGDVDIFMPQAYGTPDRLYRNQGAGTFEDVAVALGVASTEPSRLALFFDADGDHRLDLLVAGDSFQTTSIPPFDALRLYRQTPRGNFVDVTAGSGLVGALPNSDTHWGGMAAGDIDNDGDLDLIITQWSGGTKLYRNKGDGTFADITESSGVALTHTHAWQPLMYDFDGDGWLDIFIAVDFMENRLWLNQGDDTFVDVAPAAGVNSTFNEMGIATGDPDGDGDIDLFVTNIFNDFQGRHNVFFRNDSVAGVLEFAEIAESLGVDDTGWGWGTTFLDADRDGWMDLAATNGWSDFTPFQDDESRYFRNAGSVPLAFEDLSDAAQFNDTEWGSSLVAADFDRDGDVDMIQSCLQSTASCRLYINEQDSASADHGWIVIRPRQPGPNNRAIGSIVRVRAGARRGTSLITAGSSLAGQAPAEAFFGLGEATFINAVTVEWPDGTQTVVSNAPVNRVITITPDGLETCLADLAGVDGPDGEVGFADLTLLLSGWGPCDEPCPSPCPGDLDGDCAVGFTDLTALLGAWGPCR